VALKRRPDFATTFRKRGVSNEGPGQSPGLFVLACHAFRHCHTVPRKHSASGLIPLLLCETTPIYFDGMLSLGFAPLYDSNTSKLLGGHGND
jgi:hypothetical protein